MLFWWFCLPTPSGGAFSASSIRVGVPFSSSSFWLVLHTPLFLWVVVLPIPEKKSNQVNQIFYFNSMT